MTSWLLQDPDAEPLTLLSLPDLNQVKHADASVKNHQNVGAQIKNLFNSEIPGWVYYLIDEAGSGSGTRGSCG